MPRRTLLAFAALILLSAPALAAPPVLNNVAPRGLQRGQTATLTFSGVSLGQAGPEILTALPGSLGAVKTEDPNKITVPVTVAADAPVGFYPVQIRTADGLTGRLVVAVDDLPQTTEKEPNDERDAAQELTLPVTVQGACVAADRDHFRFSARKGEPLVIEVEARRMGSGLDPAITLFDSTGHELATESDAVMLGGDPRLVFSAPADGIYTLEINDIKYGAGGDPFYRLKIGTFACAEAVFPLGWKRGEAVEATFLGGNLPAPIRTRITTPAEPDLAWTPVLLPSAPSGTSPFRFVLGNSPEAMEPDGKGPHVWTSGTVMNGRIAAAGEVDRYKVTVSPGQTLVFDVDAAQLGSKLDGVLRLAKPDGAVLAETDDSQGFDPQLTFTVPADLKEVVVSIEDLLGRGGPSFAYRLKATPAAADYTLVVVNPTITIPQGSAVVVPVTANRQNFNDAIQLSIPSDLAGVSATGGQIAAGAKDGTIILTGAPGAPTRLVPLEIWGTAGPAAQPLRRKARVGGDGTPIPASRPYGLTAAIGTGAPVTLTTSAPSLTFLHGQKAQLIVKANRLTADKAEISISTAGLPPGIAGGNATIPGDKSEVTMEFDVDSLTPLVAANLLLTGRTRANHRDETITLPPVSAVVQRPYAFEVLTPTPTLNVGAKTVVTGVIRRIAPFDDEVKVAVEGSLPAHISIASASVAKGNALVQMELAAGSEAKPGSFDVVLRASTAMPGRKQTKDYVIPDVTIKVTVAAPPATPVASH
ncbi:MAG TPA: hypothetical protein VGZ22_30455 [Isosphaeraceae bacterium]|jgi:hypothetical protein|nr:hypothetical protein [Isosphaeraceae bacterium]